MKGFGNNIVNSLGSAELNLTIDGVSASELCRTVDYRFLEKCMLIGQTYTEQPHIVVYKNANKLQFLNIGRCGSIPYIIIIIINSLVVRI